MSLEFYRLRAKNFVLYEDLLIDFNKMDNFVAIFGENHDVDGAGSNGSGKSLIWDCLSDVLFDRTIRRHSAGTLIGEFGKSSYSSLTIKDTLNRCFYIIKKYRKHPKHKDKVFFIIKKKGVKKDLSKKKKSDTYSLIHKILGINWQIFRNRNFYGQEDSERFLKVTDHKKAEIIIKIQGLEALQKSRDQCSKEIKGLKLSEYQQEVDLVFSQNQIEEINKRIKSIKGSEDRERKALRKELQTTHESAMKYKQEMIAVEDFSEEKKLVSSHVVASRNKVKKLEDLRTELESVRNSEDQRKNQLKFETREQNRLTSEFLQLKKERKELKTQLTAICSKCGSVLDDKKKKRVYEGITEAITANETEIAKIQNEIDHLEFLISKSIKVKKVLKRKIIAFYSSKRELEEWEERAKKIGLKEVQITHQEEMLEQQVEAVDRVKRRIDELKNRGTLGLVRNEKKSVKSVLDHRQKKLKETVNEREKNEFSKHVFEKTIRFLFNSFLDNLNILTNEYLYALCGNSVSVLFSGETERGSKKIVDSISVRVSINGSKPREFRTYSGGEKNRIELATQFGLFHAVDSQFPLLGLDEPFTGLSREGKIRVAELLNKMAHEGTRIISISHEDAVRNYGTPLLVIRKNGRSVLRYG